MSNAIETSGAPHRSNKITSDHLNRQAIVYVRQSTLHQVENNQESTRLQYALRDKACQLGWPKERIVVIDEDLGHSGGSTEDRFGFQHLVAEVCLGHCGIVLSLEISRLARSCSDWYQLLENCARFATLICDQDGIYDPATYNDRLLLGLKGTMSEAELHIIKQRMSEGKRAKALRGELGLRVPIGYIRRPSGEVIKDPDEQAQLVIESVFETFERKRSINSVFRYLVEQDIRMPYRLISGPGKGELEWRRAKKGSLRNLFHNPIYAGAYAWGRSHTDPRKKIPGHPGSGRTVPSVENCEVLLKDRLPAYISWAQFELNQKQLEDNTVTAKGATRKGSSLLSGLLTCGHCGHTMRTGYTNNGRLLRYICNYEMTQYEGVICQSLAGKALDDYIAQWVLKALEPAALEVSLAVANDLEAEQKQLQKHWAQRLERAGIESERMYRQYNAVEPENRLVARTLEKQWEEALASEEKLKQEYERYMAKQPGLASPQERAKIEALAQDIPGLWRADTTTASDRQQIVRQLIERIIVTVEGKTEQVELEMHWTGGHQTQVTMQRSVASLEQLSIYPALKQRVKALHSEQMRTVDIARTLNDEGWCSARQGSPYNAHIVRRLLARMGLSTGPSQQQRAAQVEREAGEWTMSELSGKLDIPTATLHRWLKSGQLKGRLTMARGSKLWLVQADRAELARLRQLKKR